MRRQFYQIATFAAVVWFMTSVDLVLFRPSAFPIIGLALLSVIIISLIWGFSQGLWLAALGGWLIDQASVLPTSTHIIAMIGAVVLMWVLIRRFVATRSLISYLLAVMIGTAGYFLIQFTVLSGRHFFDPASLLPLWSDWYRPALWQIIFHPIIGYVIWRIFGQERYAQTTLLRQF